VQDNSVEKTPEEKITERLAEIRAKRAERKVASDSASSTSPYTITPISPRVRFAKVVLVSAPLTFLGLLGIASIFNDSIDKVISGIFF